MSEPVILVVHGITMTGASMLRCLGPLREALEDRGFRLLAPDAPHRLAPDAVQALLRGIGPAFRALDDDPAAWFADGRFWDGTGVHGDWFDLQSDPTSGARTYRALEASLAHLRAVTEGHRVVGVLGFSQGCAMAALAAGLARKGALPFGATLRFAVLLSGFEPRFDAPRLDPWPVDGLPALLLSGTRDPLFPDPAVLERLAARFPLGERHRVEGLRHEVPEDPTWVARIAAFAAQHGLDG